MTGPALIFDTETTSKNDDREIVEAAWIRPAGGDVIPRPLLEHVDEDFAGRFQPAKPIEHGAMAVHHILPLELEHCPASADFALPDGIEYVVGHNIDFDWHAAGAPAAVKRICTDAMARWTWPGADSYSQSALLYMLLGATPETRELLKGAHGATVDVLNNARLLEAILDARPEIRTWSALYEFSEACRVPPAIPFGKWKGSTLAEVVECDPGYVDWMLRQEWLDPYLRYGLWQAMDGRADEIPF